jgi:hypothetical protein
MTTFQYYQGGCAGFRANFFLAGRWSKEKNGDMKGAANDEKAACDGEQEGIFHGDYGYDHLDCSARDRGVEADTCRKDDDLVYALRIGLRMVTCGDASDGEGWGCA